MALQDTDISWQVLRQIVHDWAGAKAELAEVRPLEGGSTSTTVVLLTKLGDRAVLKLTQHRMNRAHADEAAQLHLLKQIGLPTPEVYRCEIGALDQPFSYLLMEFCDGVDLAHARSACGVEECERLERELAGMVRELHAQTGVHYRRLTSVGHPERHEVWASLFHELYDAIWLETQRVGHLPIKIRKLIGKVHERLPQLLSHDDCPRLLHGDLWSSNVLAHQNGDGAWRIRALLDPSCRYGHAECELAYLELFRTVSSVFLRTYQGGQHLSNEYHRVRKPVYQLYELLNHLQLFGPEYLKPTLEAVDRVSHLV